jgi:hypothetical protein
MMSSDDSPPNNDSVLPTLQQAYHHNSDAMILDRLTLEGEEPGECDYEFGAAFSDAEELAEFDYGEDIKSDRASQSSDDEDDLYWGPKLQPTADRNDCDHSNPNPDRDNTNRNITHSSTHSNRNADVPSPDNDDEGSLYGAALPEIGSDGGFCFASDNDACDPDYEPGSDHGSQDMDVDMAPVDASDNGGTPEPISTDEVADDVFWDYREVNGKRKQICLKICDKCKVAVSLGDGSGLHAYFQHQDSAHCRSDAAKLGKKKQQLSIADLWKPRPALSVVPSPDFTPPISPSPSLCTTSPTDRERMRIPIQDDSLPKLFMLLCAAGLCPGVLLDYSGSTFRKYPWQLHELENLSFTPEYFASHGGLYICSKKCHCMPRRQGETCSEFLSLNTSVELNRLRGRATGPMPVTTNFKFYSYDQLHETLARKNKEKDAYRLEVSHSMLVRTFD